MSLVGSSVAGNVLSGVSTLTGATTVVATTTGGGGGGEEDDSPDDDTQNPPDFEPETEDMVAYENYDRPGSTGTYGENLLNNEIEGSSQVTIRVPGYPIGRRVDRYNPANRAAYEAKTGYTSYTKGIAEQIKKDKWILDNRAVTRVDSYEWHFYRSPKTGRIGPSDRLRQTLQDAGIKIRTHEES